MRAHARGMRRLWLLLGPLVGALACWSAPQPSSSSCDATLPPGEPLFGSWGLGSEDGGSPCTSAGGTCVFSECATREHFDYAVSCLEWASTCCMPDGPDAATGDDGEADADDAGDAGAAGDAGDAGDGDAATDAGPQASDGGQSDGDL
jgi:hypothetical protein